MSRELLLIVTLSIALSPLARRANAAGDAGDRAALADVEEAMRSQAMVIRASDIPVPRAAAGPHQGFAIPGVAWAGIPGLSAFQVHPRIRAGVEFDDNIKISSNHREGDFIFSVSPGLRVEAGDTERREESYLLLDYEATQFAYWDHPEEDSLDHEITLELQKRFSRSALRYAGQYQILAGADVELGQRIAKNVFTNHLEYLYSLTHRTTLTWSSDFQSVNYKALPDFNEYRTGLAAGYLLTEKIRVGMEAGVGTVKVNGVPSRDYSQLLATLYYSPSPRFTFDCRGGADNREKLTGWKTRPIYGFGLLYRPSDRTQVRFSAERRIRPSSALAGIDYAVSAVTLSARQAVFRRLLLGLDIGYDRVDYDREQAATSRRQDDFYFARASIAYNFNDLRSARLFYRRRQNESNLNGVSFTENEVGVEIQIAF